MQSNCIGNIPTGIADADTVLLLFSHLWQNVSSSEEVELATTQVISEHANQLSYTADETYFVQASYKLSVLSKYLEKLKQTKAVSAD